MRGTSPTFSFHFQGHWSKECPNQGRGRAGGSSGGKDRDTCNRCGEPGHWARDCPKPSDWRPRDGGRESRDGGRRGFDDRGDFDFGGRGRSDYDRGASQISVVGSRDAMSSLGRSLASAQMGGGLGGAALSAGSLGGGVIGAPAGVMGGGATMGGSLTLNMGGGLSGRDPYAPVRDPYGAPRPDAYGAQRPDPYGAPRPEAFGPPRPDSYGVPQRDPYGPPRDSFRSSDPYARDSGYPPMRDRSPLRAPASSIPSDSFFRRTPPRSLPPKEDMYGRMQYGAIDDRPAYGSGNDPLAAYGQSSLGSSAGGGLPGRSYPMEQDRYVSQLGGGQLAGGHPAALDDLGMSNGAGRATIGYAQPSPLGSANDVRSMGFPASSHLPAQDRGFGGYSYAR